MHQMHQKRSVHDRRVRDEPAHLEFRGCRAPVSSPSMSAGTRPRPRCRFSGGGPAARAWRLVVPTACADAGAAAAATVFCVKRAAFTRRALSEKRALLPPRRGAGAAPPAPLRSGGVVGMARRRVTCRAQRERLNADAQALLNKC